MCIAYFQIGNSEWPLFIAANRDELHKRPTISARPWHDRPSIISGIDVLAGGTWLGVNHNGRYALLTNYRDLDNIKTDATSRGNLVSDFLITDLSPKDYIENIFNVSDSYNGFNLVIGDLKLNSHYYLSNSFGNKPDYYSKYQELKHDKYILTNHVLDTPWPKSQLLYNNFEKFDLNMLHLSFDKILDVLQDTTRPDDKDLPDTGIDLELERLLSSPFIINDEYGTRCSTIIAIHKSGKAFFTEVNYDTKGIEYERNSWPFELV